MKKILSIALALCMIFALCAVSASADEKELRVWLWDDAFNGNAMRFAAEEYQKIDPDFKLTIELKADSSECEELLTLAGTSGDYSNLPDIVLMQDNSCQKFISTYPELFVDLTDSGIDFSTIAAGKTAFSVVDGANYGVGFDSGTAIAAYRTDILDAAGYTIEDLTDISWDRWIEIAEDILAKTGMPLLSDPLDSSDMIMIMLKSTGSALFDDEGNAFIADNEALYDVIGTYQKLVEKGVIYRAADWAGYTSTIADDQVAGVINGSWIIATMNTATGGKAWKLTNLPALEGGTNYSSNGGSSWIVCTGGNTELAEKFLAATFAGSADLYDHMLSDESCGAIGNFLPAADTPAYGSPLNLFCGEAVYPTILAFGDKVPAFATGAYYYDARDAVSAAASNYAQGADLAKELQQAQDDLEFAMG